MTRFEMTKKSVVIFLLIKRISHNISGQKKSGMLQTSPVLSSTGHKYYVLFLDNYSNFLWTFPISHKSQVYPIFQKLRAYIKTQFKREIKTIQCDNGGELNGISFCLSCPYTSSQNGKAERKIRSINNIIHTLLIHASLPPSFWHYALEMATLKHLTK
jgi:hypothetical protein